MTDNSALSPNSSLVPAGEGSEEKTYTAIPPATPTLIIGDVQQRSAVPQAVEEALSLDPATDTAGDVLRLDPIPQLDVVPPVVGDVSHLDPSTEHTATAVAKKPARPTKSYAREILEMVLLSVLFFFGWQSIIGQRVVDGLSMEPNFHTDERVLINQLEYFHVDWGQWAQFVPGVHVKDGSVVFPFGGPHRGDVVVLALRVRSEDLIKRVIGLPGDTVEVRCAATGRNCATYVNDKKLEELYINETMNTPFATITVPQGQYFVMGDNRNNSFDSRYFGTIKMDDIVGHAFVVIWPFKNFEVVPKPDYKDPTLK